MAPSSRRGFRLTLLLASALTSATAAFAQVPDAKPMPTPDPWRFRIAPYLWLVGFDGNFTLDGQDVEGDGDGEFPGELDLTGGFLVHLEAARGPWSLAVDSVHIDLEIHGEATPPDVSRIDLSGAIVEGFAARALGDSWEVLAGARYYGLDVAVDYSQGGVFQPELDGDASWIDPIAGLRYRTELGEQLSLLARADVSGFGLGSDFAWSGSVLFGYAFSAHTQLYLGYRALAFDFAEGSGTDRLDYEIHLGGPLLGLSFSL